MPYQSLYLHVPFCAAKCDYCAFYSEPRAPAALRRQYLDHLQAELAQVRQEQALASIFLGGGTPTMLPVDELDELLRMIRRSFHLAADCEWTVESNPDSLTPEKIEILAQHGVNRVSLGVQSFLPRLRRTLGRRGEVTGLRDLLARLRASGIARQNLDLIFAIPGQSLADWQDDLARAVELGVEHISAYALTIEEGTRLAAEGVVPADDADFEAMWEASDDLLGEGGLARYEVSNFARPGAECRHNLSIWHGATYLGCGPAATSFDGITRWTQPASLGDWLAGVPPERDVLSARDRACEILAFGFRTVHGWQGDDFQARTGFAAEALRGEELAELVQQGLLARHGDRLAPTATGLLFNDSVVGALL
jgi:oxygen-independent coproporphyrinogen III oxidase